VAKAKAQIKVKPSPKRTSIGKSRKSKPLNKHKGMAWKQYRGQGK